MMGIMSFFGSNKFESVSSGNQSIFISTTDNLLDNSILEYDSNGNLLSSIPTPRRIRGITLDSQNNLILVGDYNSIEGNDNVYKFDSDNNLILSFSSSMVGNKVRTDSVDNFIIAGNRFNFPVFGFTSLIKYNTLGSVIWRRDHGSSLASLAIDSSDNIYVAGSRTTNLTTRKYNSSGTLQWSVDHGASANDIDVDSNGNIVVVGTRNNIIGGVNNTTRKYNSSGTLQWSVDHGGSSVFSVAVDSLNNVITSGSLISGVTTRKYDSSGVLLWSIDIGYTTTRSLEVDINDNIYIVADSGSSKVLLKYNSSGQLLLSVTQSNFAFDVVVKES